MTIGMCGWMEREFMRSLHKDTKDNFKAKRYMDDVLLFMKKEGWDATRFYEDFKRSECYMPPLRLEEANDGTFLETSFEVQHGRINYRLKNTNTRSKEVWRYHSFDSYATFGQKRVLPPVSERLAIRTMAQGAALGALLGCGCRVYG